MIKYFKNKRNPLREGASTMASTGTSGAGTSGAGTSGAGTSGAGTSVAGTSPSVSSAEDTGQYIDPGLGKDPVYLSTLNASNITIIKDKVDELVGLKQQLTDLSAKVDQNSTALTQLSTQMSDNANQMLGRDPNSTEPIPQATGLD